MQILIEQKPDLKLVPSSLSFRVFFDRVIITHEIYLGEFRQFEMSKKEFEFLVEFINDKLNSKK
jgi:hypothetical protein